MPTRILGISAFYHDSAACLVEDGVIVAAAQEERFSREKNDERFPVHAVRYCLREGRITPRDLDLVGFYEKPLVRFERLLETHIASAPRGLRAYLRSMEAWLGDKLWIGDRIREHLPGYRGEILFGDHHESHAASAFYPSPFEQAAILTVDGVGEWATSAISIGRGGVIETVCEQRFPHSLGLFYSAFTAFLGFRVNSGEYKVMGLAPYGEPKYARALRASVIDIGDDGRVWLNPEYFTFTRSLSMTGPAIEKIVGGPPRVPESAITQRDLDLARSVQIVTEDAMLAMSRFAYSRCGIPNLCLAGGVALNCVANSRILRDGPFEALWIQPAAGDAGGALGVAFALWHRHLGKPRVICQSEEPRDSATAASAPGRESSDGMRGALLGPSFTSAEVLDAIRQSGFVARRVNREELAWIVAEMLAGQAVVGLFQGRMEFGPRALGARSIIADPRSSTMQAMVNEKIKFRESFRPFAPAVLHEHAPEWFDLRCESPYMLLTGDVAAAHRKAPETAATGLAKQGVRRSTIPAVTHVDYSARLQTVRRAANPAFYDILDAFYRKTGCPVLLNTSFNRRGEPIVCTPADALACFAHTNLDALVIEDFVLTRGAQPALGTVVDTRGWVLGD